MAYIDSPPWAKWAQRVALSLRYGFTAVVGGLATQLTSHGATAQLAGYVILASSLVCLLGVSLHRYRLEWVALSPLVAALAATAVMMSGRVSGVVAFLIAALAATLLDRIVHLTRVAMRLRRLPPKEA